MPIKAGTEVVTELPIAGTIKNCLLRPGTEVVTELPIKAGIEVVTEMHIKGWYWSCNRNAY